MPKISIVKGTTSKLIDIFVQDSSSTVGAGLTGLAFGTSGLTAYYYREGAGSAVAITLATMTLGTWATGGFIVVDGTNLPGCYQLGIPNAAIASGANSVIVMLKGATNMAPVLLEIELTGTDNQDAVRGGMTALPNGSLRIKKNAAVTNFLFKMVSSTDHVTAKTGLTVTAQRSLDGGAFGACANSPTEIAQGWYTIALAAADTNADAVVLLFTGTAADATDFPLITQP